MSTADVVSYLHWKKDVDEHDYAAACSYLSIRFGERRAQEVAADCASSPSSLGGPTMSCGPRGAFRCPCPILAC